MIRPAETSGPGLLLLPAGNQPVISRNNLIKAILSVSFLLRADSDGILYRLIVNKLLIF